jgi:hypothetical protein
VPAVQSISDGGEALDGLNVTFPTLKVLLDPRTKAKLAARARELKRPTAELVRQILAEWAAEAPG